MTESSLLALGFGLTTTAFLGSWHCAAMCGPIVCLVQNRKQLLAYHLGRIASYTLLGFLAGSLGRTIFSSPWGWLRGASFLVLLGLVLLMILELAFELLRGKGLAGPAFLKPKVFLFNRLSHGLFEKSKEQNRLNFPASLALGGLSVLIPCGWLYSFVAGAAATQSGFGGALVMFVFAVSAIPALSLAPHFFTQVLKASPIRQKILSLVVLSLSALYALGAHFFLS